MARILRPKPVNLWRERRRALKAALTAWGAGDPEGLHDVRVALRRTVATASALRDRSLARRAKALVRSLSERRQLEVDRQLLARVRELGILSPDVAAGLDARWDRLIVSACETEKIASGKPMRRLLERLAQREADPGTDPERRLQRARNAADRKVARTPDGRSSHELHRYRIAVKKARYIAENLALLGVPDAEASVARLKTAQEALGRWNDVRLFRRHLRRTHREAEKRGAVTLALQLDRLLEALDRTEEKARADALEAARRLSNVVKLDRRAPASRAAGRPVAH